jgi:hypothetical protein
MSIFFRRALRTLLRSLARYPALKRLIVDVIYRFPSLDGKLRTAAHRIIHPEAVLDVDARRMPESSRRVYNRMRRPPRP